jgi:ABC-type polysaccharide/polyol phosphate transport system ATPase subunit
VWNSRTIHWVFHFSAISESIYLLHLNFRAKETTVRIKFEDVVQRFRIIQERPDTLREAFAKFRRRISYHDFEALKHVSFQVAEGEMVGIIGRNGSGKSTILKIVAGVYIPTSGAVAVNGSIAPLIELGAGFHHELTGRENILLNGLLLGLSKREVLSREPQIIEFAELGDFIDVPVKQYSSGMYMRLAFAIATEVNPDILLIDEILAVGDGEFRRKCFERIEHFRNLGKTILFVSHDLTSIRQFCDRALLLHGGELMEDGSPEFVISRYEALLAQHVDSLRTQAWS